MKGSLVSNLAGDIRVGHKKINRMKNIKIQSDALVIYFEHETASFATFCLSQYGDLFINSDWGCFMFSWRSFGSNFPEFLSGCDVPYIAQKLENMHRSSAGKAIPKNARANLELLIGGLLDVLKGHLK